jgi:hypothetical protein
MNLDIFREYTGKKHLQQVATIKFQQMSYEENAMDILILAKKLKYFAEEFVKISEKEAKMVYDQEKERYNNVTYTQGGAILNYFQDEKYAELSELLRQRKQLLDTAHRMKEPIYDGEGVEVPKVKIKTYRKDSLNVSI